MFHQDYDSNDLPGRLHGWGRQAKRGDMRLIILHVLKDRPMHGYEIIKYLEDKSHGLWRPSPGSIYPTLQLLEDEGFVASSEADGKRIYEVTASGKTEAGAGPHEHWRKFEDAGSMRELHQTGFEMMHQLKQIVRARSESDMAAALKSLKTAHAELSAIINKQGDSDAK